MTSESLLNSNNETDITPRKSKNVHLLILMCCSTNHFTKAFKLS
jgi:hypothetical protein